ncbi:DUF4259 domain-containing protein [Actinacidiphila alni]|uniref:DUF4259 domain-containing protein n=1 Tax=Actinacidiphila alni TaxID=380248 RepID=UPI0033E8EAF6
MGTWDIGPFDNDTAAGFAGDLDEAALEEREPMIRRVLKRAADVTDFLEIPDAELWDDVADGRRWRQDITRLRDVLDPPVPLREEVLFGI